MLFSASEAPVAGVKLKVADWISRVLENPVTTTVKVSPEALYDTALTVGATFGTVIEIGARFGGVTLIPLG